MPKIYFRSATPINPTGGADVYKGGTLDPAEVDQSFRNVQNAINLFVGEAYSQAEETAMFAAGYKFVVRMDLIGATTTTGAPTTSTTTTTASGTTSTTTAAPTTTTAAPTTSTTTTTASGTTSTTTAAPTTSTTTAAPTTTTTTAAPTTTTTTAAPTTTTTTAAPTTTTAAPTTTTTTAAPITFASASGSDTATGVMVDWADMARNRFDYVQYDSAGNAYMAYRNATDNKAYVVKKPSGGTWGTGVKVSDTTISFTDAYHRFPSLLVVADEIHVFFNNNTNKMSQWVSTNSGVSFSFGADIVTWSSNQIAVPIKTSSNGIALLVSNNLAGGYAKYLCHTTANRTTWVALNMGDYSAAGTPIIRETSTGVFVIGFVTDYVLYAMKTSDFTSFTNLAGTSITLPFSNLTNHTQVKNLGTTYIRLADIIGYGSGQFLFTICASDSKIYACTCNSSGTVTAITDITSNNTTQDGMRLFKRGNNIFILYGSSTGFNIAYNDIPGTNAWITQTYTHTADHLRADTYSLSNTNKSSLVWHDTTTGYELKETVLTWS